MSVGKGLSGHQRAYQGATDEWYTPPEIFRALGLTFDLDPCSPVDGSVPWIPARRFLTARDNGLTAAWSGLVWLNPPYGPETGRWLTRLAAHGDGVALVPARTDTRWWHDVAPKADAVCFLKGRPHFYTREHERARHNSGAPIALLAYGQRAAKAVRECGLGMIAVIEGAA